MLNFSTLGEMLDSEVYQLFISSKLGNDLFINDPERAERLHEAAEYGIDGSLHCEVIEDWRDFLNTLNIPDDDELPELCESEYDIDAYTESAILNEINSCEEWHIKNGTYDQQIG